MKLLHVYPTFAVGGAQARFVAIANHFGRRWSHVIIAMDGVTSCGERLDPALDVCYRAAGDVKGDTLGNLRRFRAILREEAPDCLVTSNWGTIEWAMAATLSGVRHVHMEDGFGPDERAGQLPRRVWTRRLVLRRRRVMVPSHLLERIALDVWRLPASAVRYVPNGVDLARFHPAAGREGVPVIGTVAALRAEKNLGRLVEAFAVLRQPARLVIVGDGPERAALTARVKALGIEERVTFAGNQADTAPFYRGFDIFALSSDTEQMPLSVLEAMASGLPVVSTDVGDVRGMVAQEGAGLVVARETAALSGALDGLLGDGARRALLGAANRARAAAEFDQAQMFAAYAALYEGTM